MLIRMLVIILVLGAIGIGGFGLELSGARVAQAIDFNSDRWAIEDQRARKEERLGRQSLYLTSGFAWLKDVSFSDGTIEVDIAAADVRAFLGVVFRFSSPDEHEIVYLRPHKTGLDDAVQYSPSFQGSAPWQLYNGPGYTAAADLPKEQWLRFKLEFRGYQAKVYLNEKVALEIRDLKRDYARGSVGLWGGARGGHFSNFRYTEAAGTAPPPAKPKPVYPRGIITDWELSDAYSFAERELESYPGSAAMKAMKWQRVGVEPPGMVVIDRYRRSPGILPPFAGDPTKRLAKTPEKSLVYLRTTIEAERDEVRRLSFGYSDEAAIFLNGRIIFSGRSAFRFRDPGFLGIADVENDAVFLPLRRGTNELVVAVGEYFGGWGLICRLDDRAQERQGSQSAK